MKTLLRIDASARITGSHSRALADYFEAKWKKNYPNGKVIYRDLVKQEIPHIPNSTIEGFYTREEDITEETLRSTALSDELISELRSADELLISSPLYNFNIPSNLKAYFDHITRVGHTFNITEEGRYYGLLSDKVAYVVTVKGSVYKGTPMEPLDFQDPYLIAILRYLGIEVKGPLALEGTSDRDILIENRQEMHKTIDQIFSL